MVVGMGKGAATEVVGVGKGAVMVVVVRKGQ